MSKIFRPGYYKLFSCIAGECEDSCCRSGWEIPLDDETFSFYKSCGAEDIEKNTVTGSDGGRIFKLSENGNCPYLDEKGLCRLYALTGGRLGEICSKYPRFTEEYDGFTEEGISISCPEAQRLILSAEPVDYALDGELPDEELLSFLHKARKRAFEIVFAADSPDEAAAKLLDFGDVLEEYLFDEYFDLPMEELYFEPSPLRECYLKGYSQIAGLILDKTDILYPEWRELMQTALNGDMKAQGLDDKTGKAYLYYLIFRYFLKGVNIESVGVICRFIAGAYILTTRLPGEFLKNARLFAKEVEHDGDNLDALLDAMIEIYFA